MKYTPILIILIIALFSNTGHCQTTRYDSAKPMQNVSVEASPSMKAQLFNPHNLAKFYYKGEPNLKIFQKGKKFFEQELYDSGQIKSSFQVSVMITKSSLTQLFKVKNDTTRSLVTNYDLSLTRNGIYREYYLNGKLKILGFYKWGNKDRNWKFYDNQGHLIKKEKWRKGSLKTRCAIKTIVRV